MDRAAIEARLDYAFSPKWGYLTACPTNLGTGIRLSVMMHLSGLKMTNDIERVRKAASLAFDRQLMSDTETTLDGQNIIVRQQI